MMSSNILVFGAGGHAKVLINALQEMGCDNIAVTADEIPNEEILGYPTLQKSAIEFTDFDFFTVAIGNNHVRQDIYNKLKKQLLPITIVHPRSSIAKSARIGAGTVILPQAVLHPDCTIGENVIVNTGAIIEHDCVIEDHAQIAPRATLCGGVVVGKKSLIATGAVVVPKIKIGNNSVIAAGAVVVRDVPDNVLVMGCPAKIVREIEA